MMVIDRPAPLPSFIILQKWPKMSKNEQNLKKIVKNHHLKWDLLVYTWFKMLKWQGSNFRGDT